MARNTHFMFGAGASAYSQELGPCPPLGDGLFDELCKVGPTWDALPEEDKRRFRSTAGGFEKAMELVRDKHDQNMKRMLTEIGLYFSSFRLFKDNVYLKFVECILKHIKNKEDNIYLSTLNYDYLLNLAIEIHWDIYFVPQLHGSPLYAPQTNLHDVDLFGAKVHLESRVQGILPGDAYEYWNKQLTINGVAPVIALYAPSKPVLYSPSFIQKLQLAWAEGLVACDRIFLIGLRCSSHDIHLWQPIARAPGRVIFVNPSHRDCEEFSRWASRERSTKQNQIITKPFSEFVRLLKLNRIGDAIVDV